MQTLTKIDKMNSERIKEIQEATAYPESLSVKQGLLQVWNECEQDSTPQWIRATDRLPEEHKFRMSRDVLTIAGSKINVKSYDYGLNRWNGSPHITITHWMPLPEKPEL